tara:strand:- start:308 stop:1357 length:1050 start_codon:yes stop_codon:yes gene_type:complete
MKKDISQLVLWLLLIVILGSTLVFGQGDFFKYSTFYTSMSMNTSMVERENYMAIDKGYEDITQVNDFDYALTFGVRKIARFDYEYKVKTWYYGDEKAISDNVAIGNAKGWEYLANYSFIRNRGEKFTEQDFWLRYLGGECVTKVQYKDNQRVNLKYTAFDTRYRLALGKLDITAGLCFRVHPAYGFLPIRDFWTPGESTFTQLANDFGYSSEFVDGSWHWFEGDELLATSNDEFYKHYFGQAIADFNERELDKLGFQKELSAVIGLAYYTYNPNFWIHAWVNCLPYHYGLDDYSFEYEGGLINNMDWDSGIILGARITKHLGVFIEGNHQRYWDKPVYECKFGFNYLMF